MAQIPMKHVCRIRSSTFLSQISTSSSRSFSTTPIPQSKLARKPISVPNDVTLTLVHPKPPTKPPANPWQEPEERTLRIDGPKGIVFSVSEAVH
jgi:hypothetical protein